MNLSLPSSVFTLLALATIAQAGPARPALRSEAPAAVEAELATREALCRLDRRGGLLIPKEALARRDLNQDGRDDFILTLCRLACADDSPKPARACDQSLIFLSSQAGHRPIRMPGEVLDIRHLPGQPMKLLSSAFSDHAACPVEDGVCNPLYEIRNGELVQAGIE